MKTIVIKLTMTQYMRLGSVLDRACYERPGNLHLQDLRSACAKTETVETPETPATPA